MTIRRQALTTSGTLLTVLLIFAAYTRAQTSRPTLTTLHNFVGGTSDGAQPYAGVVIGGGGVLYGTTYGGGSDPCTLGYHPPGCGTVFSLTPPVSPGDPWTYTVLYNFAGGSDGAHPFAGLVIGSGGVLYGTTDFGGTSGIGTVFSLTPPASPDGSWTETVIHSFTGSDGAQPGAGVVIGSGGVLYGTAFFGGTGSSCNGVSCGVVFALTPPAFPGDSWTETVLHNFSGYPSDGAQPFAGVVIGSGGVLYGTTSSGGPDTCGTVFSLTPPTSPGGAWTYTVLYSFTGGTSGGGSDGAGPWAVVIGSGGVLYGTTAGGGTSNFGTVFSLTPPTSPGGSWTETVLHSFTDTPDGREPDAGPVIGSGGVLYGTAEFGGTSSACIGGCGMVFSLTPPTSPGGAWTYAVLYNFAGGSGGSNPWAAVVIGSGGVLYGTTFEGGNGSCSGGCGAVFSLKPGTALSPSINPGGVVNAANYVAPVAPGSIASAFGNFVLSSSLGTTQSPLPTDLSGLSLRFGGGTLAPLFFVTGGQVNFQVPWELSGQSQSMLAATVNNVAGAAQTVSLAPFAPAIFSMNSQGSGQGAILDTSYNLVDSSNPTTANAFVLIYCTGLGAVTNQPATGSPGPSNPLAWSTTPTVTIGGVPADVSFFGLAPGYVGLYQVNAQVPAGLAANSAVPVVIAIGGVTSNTVTMALQ
jgi:uncharacterized protein (TIGR03437 family)